MMASMTQKCPTPRVSEGWGPRRANRLTPFAFAAARPTNEVGDAVAMEACPLFLSSMFTAGFHPPRHAVQGKPAFLQGTEDSLRTCAGAKLVKNAAQQR